MELMLTGIVLWSLVHLMPAISPSTKIYFTNRFGENAFKLTFTLLIILAVFLIIYGWRHSTTTYLYQLPAFIYPVASLLLFFSFILFASTIIPTRLVTYIRHPQLMFVLSWSIAHLLVNGDYRSVILFSGMAIWGLLEMIFINRRDGAWSKPANPVFMTEIKSIILSIVLFVVAVLAHEYLSGVSLHWLYS